MEGNAMAFATSIQHVSNPLVPLLHRGVRPESRGRCSNSGSRIAYGLAAILPLILSYIAAYQLVMTWKSVKSGSKDNAIHSLSAYMCIPVAKPAEANAENLSALPEDIASRQPSTDEHTWEPLLCDLSLS